MNAPPIQYVTTRDGLKIAYCDVGQGTPLIWGPLTWSDQRWVWGGTLAPALHYLAQEYRVITFDARGQGASSRGLNEGHSLADYEQDIEALVEELGLQSFVLSGFYFYALVAMDYARRHPDGVRGLIIRNVNRDYGSSAHWRQLAVADWTQLVYMQASVWFYGRPQIETAELIKDWYTQDDYVKVVRAVVESDLTQVLPPAMPILVTADVNGPKRWNDDAREIAAATPGSRLAFLGRNSMVWSGNANDPLPAGITVVRDFMHEVAPPSEAMPARSILTPRETEVLRLIAAGRTSREISGSLVLSERTVARHITNLYGKIGARGRAEATAYAFQHKLT